MNNFFLRKTQYLLKFYFHVMTENLEVPKRISVLVSVGEKCHCIF